MMDSKIQPTTPEKRAIRHAAMVYISDGSDESLMNLVTAVMQLPLDQGPGNVLLTVSPITKTIGERLRELK